MLNGLKSNEKYASESRVLELLPQTWDSITSKLRRWDTDETNSKKELVNFANSTKIITCHTCDIKGHKSYECPTRAGGAGGKGGGGRKEPYNEAKPYGRASYGTDKKNTNGRNSKPPNNNNKGKNYKNYTCNICQEKGHASHQCSYAAVFAKMLPKLKRQKQDRGSKARNNDGNSSDSSLMLTNFSEDVAFFDIHSAALDSGCSSHTLKESVVPNS